MTSALAMVVAGLLLAAEEPLPVEQEVEELAFDRPESWAMKYFAAVALPTGMGVPAPVSFGELRLGLEAGWIPSLSPEERRVGFNGTKKEDLNKVPVLGRLRLAVGLPWQLTADVTWTPPIEVSGVTAHPFSLGLGRPIVATDRVTVGARAFAGRSSVQGAFTCSRAAPEALEADEHEEGEEEAEHGHAADMSDCAAPSDDSFTAEYAGLEVGAAYRFREARDLETYVSTSATYMDLEFQVDAQLMTHLDRNRLETDGMLYGFAGGLRMPVTDRLSVSGEAFYAPLTVKRPTDSDSQIEGLLNVRGLLEVRF